MAESKSEAPRPHCAGAPHEDSAAVYAYRFRRISSSSISSAVVITRVFAE